MPNAVGAVGLYLELETEITLILYSICCNSRLRVLAPFIEWRHRSRVAIGNVVVSKVLFEVLYGIFNGRFLK